MCWVWTNSSREDVKRGWKKKTTVDLTWRRATSRTGMRRSNGPKQLPIRRNHYRNNLWVYAVRGLFIIALGTVLYLVQWLLNTVLV